jgi:hypothetical protein
MQAGTLALALAAALVAVAVLLVEALLDAAKVWPTKARAQKERGMKVLNIMVAFFFGGRRRQRRKREQRA